MPNARRFALSALLLGGSAALAALVVAISTPRYAGARVPAAAELPWPAGARDSDRRLPFVLLYVDSHCGHCSRAAVLVDSIASAHALRALIVSKDSVADAEGYRHRLALSRPVTRDSSATLLRALGTRSVPTLVLFHRDGSRELIVGFRNDALYRRALDGIDR